MPQNENASPGVCSQEPRLITLETVVAGIGDTLKDVKDLLKFSIQTDERVNVLKQENIDQEKRIRKLETAMASGRWLERVAWLAAAAGMGWLFHKG